MSETDFGPLELTEQVAVSLLGWGLTLVSGASLWSGTLWLLL